MKLHTVFAALALSLSVAHAAEVPELVMPTDPDKATRYQELVVNNSICAGYYNSMAIGEMGSVSSLFGLMVKNDTSAAQKLAVRLFTEHSNAYKRMGAMSRDAYDLGGRIGGQIFMGGTYEDKEADILWKKSDAEHYCALTRKGIVP